VVKVPLQLTAKVYRISSSERGIFKTSLCSQVKQVASKKMKMESTQLRMTKTGCSKLLTKPNF
jgi:hypothetical protein